MNSTIVYISTSHNTRYLFGAPTCSNTRYTYKHPIYFCKSTCNWSAVTCTSTGNFVSLIPSHLLHLSLRGIVLQLVYPGTSGGIRQTCQLTYPTFGNGENNDTMVSPLPWFLSLSSPFPVVFNPWPLRYEPWSPMLVQSPHPGSTISHYNDPTLDLCFEEDQTFVISFIFLGELKVFTEKFLKIYENKVSDTHSYLLQ